MNDKSSDKLYDLFVACSMAYCAGLALDSAGPKRS
jgi:hypothetical protein